MIENLPRALAAGSERVIAWADVLDRINVFPVPDGDTGRNLVVSLSPLKQTGVSVDRLAQDLLMSARGNSGNIAARFFSGFIAVTDPAGLAFGCRRGRDLAYQAVSDPMPGTMLTLFDVLVEALEANPPEPMADDWVDAVIEALENAVRSTTAQLPELQEAGVVDAGALGMFIFFEACFNLLVGRESAMTPLVEKFKDSLSLADSWIEGGEDGFCLDVVLQVEKEAAQAMGQVYALGESVVTIADGDFLKVHLHAQNQEAVRESLAGMGSIVRWNVDDLGAQTRLFSQSRLKQAIHVMTDAAGSITRDQAAGAGVTLLNSYINLGSQSLPETYVDPAHLLESMRQGVKVSTAQASTVERRQCYHKVLDLHPKVLYLCVGSAFTGNYQVALDWKKEHDPEDRLTVIDSGAASGRLGLIVRAVAKKSLSAETAGEVIDFAHQMVRDCREYLFLDKLQWLAAGGRLSKTSAFFGDVFKMKPVVSPMPEGVRKMGVVRSRQDQLTFALARLDEDLAPDREAWILLEYTDNESWLKGTVAPEIVKRFPAAEIEYTPVSLTSASHMGPGTWGLALLPYLIE